MRTEFLIFFVSRLKQATLRELLHRSMNQLFWLAFTNFPRLSHYLTKTPCVSVEHIKYLNLSRIYSLPNPCPQTLYHEFFLSDKNTRDIRLLWESARLQQVTSLLYQEEERCCYADAEEILFQWLRANPFLSYPHYLSAMECALRIPVFLLALKKLKLSQDQHFQLYHTIFEHAWLINQRLSLHSSLGNHTIAESVGLIFAGGVFIDSKKGKKWLEKGQKLLTQELTHQILSDGGPAEQSLSYHRFVLDLYWMTIDFLESNDLRDCSDWKPRLIAGEHFLAAFTDKLNSFPSIGDSDDGHALGPGLAPKRFIPDPCPPGIKTFPNSGYTICRFISGLLLTIDHGPLGMPPLYNHGHADALSFTLRVDGVSFFIDPGTYRYNDVPEHRRYFKGTRAHNTVTIDNKDQAQQLTSFIWNQPYETGATISEQHGEYKIEAWHDGYTRLSSPVRHLRTFSININSVHIIDSFQGSDNHEFDFHLHLHPEVKIEQDGKKIILERNAIIIEIYCDGYPELTKGQQEPLLGWYSSAYGMLEATTTISIHKKGKSSDVCFETFILVKKNE